MVSMDRMWLPWPSGAMLKRGERTEINVQWTKETKPLLSCPHGTFGAWRWREGFDGSHKKDVNCGAPRVLLMSSVKTPSRCLHSEWAYFVKTMNVVQCFSNVSHSSIPFLIPANSLINTVYIHLKILKIHLHVELQSRLSKPKINT